MCQPIKVVGTMCRPQSSRHIPCAVHLEISQKLDCERHGGACLHLLSAVSYFNATKCRTLCPDKKCPDKKCPDKKCPDKN